MTLVKKDEYGLTPRQRRFADEYLIDFNASRAAVVAGYSEKSRHMSGYTTLNNVYVSAYIKMRQEKMEKKTRVTVERVVEEYMKLAFVDPRQFYDDNGALVHIKKLPAEVAAAIVGFDNVETVGDDGEVHITKKIRFSDKKAALDSLAKHLGMFIDKKEITGFGGGPIQVIGTGYPGTIDEEEDDE